MSTLFADGTSAPDPIATIGSETPFTSEELNALREEAFSVAPENINPPLPTNKRQPWASQYVSDEYNKQQMGARFNGEGRIVVDPVVFKALQESESSGWVKRKARSGFRFLFNPPSFTESYVRPNDINYVAYLQTLSKLDNPPATVNTGAQIGLSLLLARNEDVRILRKTNFRDYYPPNSINDAQAKAIREYGTMADIEYLFRVANGEPFATWHGPTSNWGMLIPTAVAVSIGDSPGARKFRGVIQNISWVHQQFAPGMVPVYTELTLSITRIPDNYVREAPDASGTDSGENPASSTQPQVDVGGLSPIQATGDWIVPLRNYSISSGYRTSERPGHNGVDLAAPGDTPIWAPNDGRVIAVGFDNGQGHHVYIDHGMRNNLGRVTTVYMHMIRNPPVSPGQAVKKGQVIGNVGSTGDSTGNHLHFEVKLNGSHTDPVSWMKIPSQG